MNKKANFIILLSTAALVACQSNQGSQTSSSAATGSGVASSSASLPKAMALFRDACLGGLPNFANSFARAKNYKFGDPISLSPKSKSAMAPDSSYSLQVKIGKECATTSPSQAGTTVVKQFKALLAPYAKGKTIRSFPFKTRIKGKTYIFHHDRKGGEAYVVVVGN